LPSTIDARTGEAPDRANTDIPVVLFGDTRIPERVWDQIRVDASTNCWQWTGGQQTGGYGSVWLNGRKRRAHRALFCALVREVSSDCDLDHLCRVRICVNPNHLEPVSRRENLARSPLTHTGRNLRKTHCPEGHPYDGANLVVTPEGWRKCKTCVERREAARVWPKTARKSLRTHGPKFETPLSLDSFEQPVSRRVLAQAAGVKPGQIAYWATCGLLPFALTETGRRAFDLAAALDAIEEIKQLMTDAPTLTEFRLTFNDTSWAVISAPDDLTARTLAVAEFGDAWCDLHAPPYENWHSSMDATPVARFEVTA
jgi:hypothetical protein